ncbi:hypothetical protein GN109_23815 [Collimonas pratensis]|uniref:Uncharacterized protein n=1 Tax=Collimonas pratensis TaxID=279113 RepID=A0A127Q9D2_9BURK|nr:hypothetical protein [Collimonas pratensis]AMP06648.1 hypothetical protein CPter91_4338 [Collimonas pratensis]NKI72454.1 hypothetical protein [Collimonas pratensis]
MKWEFLNKRIAVFLVLTVAAVGLVSWINVLSPEDRLDQPGPVLQKALASEAHAKPVVR